MSLTPRHPDQTVDHRAAEPSVVVIGAGVSGLSCARALVRAGVPTLVLDRGRVPGGRLATRRPSPESPDDRFDHGTPFLEPPAGPFAEEIEHWIERGAAARWTPEVATWRDGTLHPEAPSARIVGFPSMAAIPALLAEGLEIRTSTTVNVLAPVDDGWRLDITPWREEVRSLGPVRSVVLAMAPGQARRLLEPVAPGLAAGLEPVRNVTIWVGMLELERLEHELPDVIETPEHPILDRLIREDGKPGRSHEGPRSRWVVHAAPEWSGARYDAERSELARSLGEAVHDLLHEITGRPIRYASEPAAHRWGMARTADPIESRTLSDPARGLVVCGDGLGGGDVAAAHLGGLAAARSLAGDG